MVLCGLWNCLFENHPSEANFGSPSCEVCCFIEGLALLHWGDGTILAVLRQSPPSIFCAETVRYFCVGRSSDAKVLGYDGR